MMLFIIFINLTSAHIHYFPDDKSDPSNGAKEVRLLHVIWSIEWTLTSILIFYSSLRTFALIVSVHPYCTRNSHRHVMPRHVLSACAVEEM